MDRFHTAPRSTAHALMRPTANSGVAAMPILQRNPDCPPIAVPRHRHVSANAQDCGAA